MSYCTELWPRLIWTCRLAENDGVFLIWPLCVLKHFGYTECAELWFAAPVISKNVTVELMRWKDEGIYA